ncbi:MAG: S16 family serine protease [Candidatus Micrarchaeota archaeon]
MKQLTAGLFAFMFLFAFAAAQTSLDVPAVDAEGKGVLSEISVSSTPGNGDIFVSIVPLTGIDTQHSEKTAVKIASELAGRDTSKLDMLFKIQSSAEVVDGPSAGAALTLLSYAELSKKKMRGDLTLTGSIEPDGSIGKVGGIFEKAKAVANFEGANFKVFLIPRGQRIQSGVDIPKYAKEKWDLQVVEVDSIEDAINFAFNTTEGENVPVVEKIIPPLKLIPFKASGSAGEFGEIAKSEIEGAKKSLQKSDVSPEVREALDESISLSQTLIAKGYYYSAANSAFLTTLTIDELSFVNGSKGELREKLREIKELANNLNFTPQNEGNFEWVIGGKLRFQWASGKLSDADDKIALGNYISAAGDLAVASSWLRASYRMNEFAKAKASGREMKDIYYRDYASNLIEKAKALSDDGLLDSEALDHLDTAIAAFENANYLTAAIDATFPISYSEAYDEMGEKKYRQIVESLCDADSFEATCDIFKDREFYSLWAQLYYAHALYNFQESNRSQDIPSLVNGIKLIKLSEGFELRRNEALKLLDNPPIDSGNGAPIDGNLPASTIAPSKQLKVEVVAIPQNSQRDLIVMSIVALVVLLALVAFLVRKKPLDGIQVSGGKISRLERAEEMVLAGKMSERSFEYFKEKYGKEEKTKVKAKAKKSHKK